MKWLVEHPEDAAAIEEKLRDELLANPEQGLMSDLQQAEITE